jgi:hypothetical protein
MQSENKDFKNSSRLPLTLCATSTCSTPFTAILPLPAPSSYHTAFSFLPLLHTTQPSLFQQTLSSQPCTLNSRSQRQLRSTSLATAAAQTPLSTTQGRKLPAEPLQERRQRHTLKLLTQPSNPTKPPARTRIGHFRRRSFFALSTISHAANAPEITPPHSKCVLPAYQRQHKHPKLRMSSKPT